MGSMVTPDSAEAVQEPQPPGDQHRMTVAAAVEERRNVSFLAGLQGLWGTGLLRGDFNLQPHCVLWAAHAYLLTSVSVVVPWLLSFLSLFEQRTLNSAFNTPRERKLNLQSLGCSTDIQTLIST